MAKLIDHALTALLVLTPLLHLLLSPHTKVEESFNLQAAHDILVYGTPTADVHARLARAYDHFAFPGAVPRTFVGAVLLAGLGQPLVAVVGFRHAQLVVRLVLGAFNVGCLLVLRRGLGRAFGKGVQRWWVAFTVCQFHVCYYLSRTLPNMYAFGLTTLATASLLPQATPRQAFVRQRQAIALLVLATTIFRSELALLLGSTGLHLLLTRRASLPSLIPVCVGSFAAALAISVPIDSYFWQKPLWPELWGFYYNAVLGISSDWGVSPWHYYFTSALPKILLNPLVLPLVAFAALQPATTRVAQPLVVPSLAYVLLYSLQPHKEARFIFYVVPGLTAAAALGANYISTRYAKAAIYKTASALLVLSVLASFAGSIGMLLLSSLNYPGGDALNQIYALVASTGPSSPSTTPVKVHADVLTCMTGLTLFGQNPAGHPVALNIPRSSDDDDDDAAAAAPPTITFDRTETGRQLTWPSWWAKFDYVLAEDPSKVLGDWDVVGVVQGYDGIEVLRPGGAVPDAEKGEGEKVLGLGATVASIRDLVRDYTGGWWAGPRMSPRIRILKRVRSKVSKQRG